MIGNMNPEVRRLIDESKVNNSLPSQERAAKELEVSRFDLGRAEASIASEDYKWATLQGYSSFLHAAGALVFSSLQKEQDYRAVYTSLKEHLTDGRFPKKHAKALSNAIKLSDAAEHGMAYSKKGARIIVADAKDFLEGIEEILCKIK